MNPDFGALGARRPVYFCAEEHVPTHVTHWFKLIGPDYPSGFSAWVVRKITGVYSHCETEFECIPAVEPLHAAPYSQPLRITVSCQRGDLVSTVCKPIRKPEVWHKVSPAMAPEDVLACYNFQMNARGLPYNDDVNKNLAARAACAPYFAAPSQYDKFYCAELMAASLVETEAAMRSVPSHLSTPQDMYDFLATLPQATTSCM